MVSPTIVTHLSQSHGLPPQEHAGAGGKQLALSHMPPQRQNSVNHRHHTQHNNNNNVHMQGMHIPPPVPLHPLPTRQLSSSLPSPSQRIKRLSFQSPVTPSLLDSYDQPNTLHRQNSLEAIMSDARISPPQKMHSGLSAPSPVHAFAFDGIAPPPLLVPQMSRATTEQFQALLSPLAPLPHNHSHMWHASEEGAGVDPSQCERCFHETSHCEACQHDKQRQFLDGWLIDDSSNNIHDGFEPGVKQEEDMSNTFPPSLLHYDPSLIPIPPVKSEHDPVMPLIDRPISDEDEQKSDLPLPPMLHTPTAPGVGQGYESLARRQGKLSRFLPEGEAEYDMEPLELPVSAAPAVPASSSGRSLRARKVRSRSPSPDFSDMSDDETHDSDSEYDADHHMDHDLDDTMSPIIRSGVVEGGDSSGQSSSEPPVPTNLLPVAASALLPSRPSTAAIPPAHIKDRLVKSAKKLLTAADGVNDNVQVQVIPIHYPHKGASGAHKIRLIRVHNTDTGLVSMYAHAADVGGVVERKSNISRLFGKFESPSEKLLMNVVGAHNHTVGQESNILTSKGIRKFLTTNKMKDEHHYRHWIQTVLLPKLLHDPMEIGEELLEIEASTDPNAPTTFKPHKMQRMERKRRMKAKEEQAEGKQQQHGSAAAPGADSASEPASPITHPSKRPKLIHSVSPPHSPSQPVGMATRRSTESSHAA